MKNLVKMCFRLNLYINFREWILRSLKKAKILIPLRTVYMSPLGRTRLYSKDSPHQGFFLWISELYDLSQTRYRQTNTATRFSP
jgi:hypothetical protein